MIRSFFVAFVIFAAPAFASEPLKTAEVDRFVSAMVAINDLDDRYPEIDVELGMDESSMGNPGAMRDAFAKIITPEGKVVLIDTIVEAVGQHPEAARELQDAMRSNGFNNPADFASVGNRLLLASARLEMSGDEIAQMQQMSNMPLEMLPPAFRDVVPFIQAFGTAVSNVPESDIEQARRVKPILDSLDDND